MGQPHGGERTGTQDALQSVRSNHLGVGHRPNLGDRPDCCGATRWPRRRCLAATGRTWNVETRGVSVDFEEIEALGRRAAAGDAGRARRAARRRPAADPRPLPALPAQPARRRGGRAGRAARRRPPHRARFEGRSKFTTWMYQLTTNAAIDCYRKLKRRRSVLEAPPDLAAGGSSPSVIAGARIDVLEAAEKLDDRLVEPVFMRDLCELEYADIAELLDVPVGTVKSRIHDGRAQLRHALYGEGGEPGAAVVAPPRHDGRRHVTRRRAAALAGVAVARRRRHWRRVDQRRRSGTSAPRSRRSRRCRRRRRSPVTRRQPRASPSAPAARSPSSSRSSMR